MKNNSESSSLPEKELRLSHVERDKCIEKQTITDIQTRPTMINSESIHGLRAKPDEEAKNVDAIIS